MLISDVIIVVVVAFLSNILYFANQPSNRSTKPSTSHREKAANAHAILLRSHKLQEEEVNLTVRAIARCGAGTNNVPVARMTELGIPVFNTPGANANAVKELVLAGMLLGSRRIVDGINHMYSLGEQGLARERVEKDKAMFGGRELKGKTLAVIGLGHIGAATARDAEALAKIYEQLDELEPVESDQEAIRLVDELFFWPLSFAFLLILATVSFTLLPGLRPGVLPV